MKNKILIGLTATLAFTLAVAMTHAAQPNKPPADSGRQTIPDAVAACAAGVTNLDLTDLFGDACNLLYDTDGTQDVDNNKCDASLDNTTLPVLADDNGPVIYAGKNCDTNEASQQKKAASVILAITSWDKGKNTAEVAAGYACDYALKADALLNAQPLAKLIYIGGRNLGNDARDIIDEINFVGSYSFTCP